MADFSPQKSADVNLDSSHEAPSLVTAPAQKESKEVHKVKEQIGQAANIESSDTVDEGIDVVGKVSETLSKTISEDDKRSSGSTSGTQFSGMTPAQIRAHLLNNLPTETAMRKQVQKEIEKEVKYLHKKAIKLMRSSKNVSYFEMSNILKKIRELKSILVTLMKASVEQLKTLWLRFVHGIM